MGPVTVSTASLPFPLAPTAGPTPTEAGMFSDLLAVQLGQTATPPVAAVPLLATNSSGDGTTPNGAGQAILPELTNQTADDNSEKSSAGFSGHEAPRSPVRIQVNVGAADSVKDQGKVRPANFWTAASPASHVPLASLFGSTAAAKNSRHGREKEKCPEAKPTAVANEIGTQLLGIQQPEPDSGAISGGQPIATAVVTQAGPHRQDPGSPAGSNSPATVLKTAEAVVSSRPAAELTAAGPAATLAGGVDNGRPGGAAPATATRGRTNPLPPPPPTQSGDAVRQPSPPREVTVASAGGHAEFDPAAGTGADRETTKLSPAPVAEETGGSGRAEEETSAGSISPPPLEAGAPHRQAAHIPESSGATTRDGESKPPDAASASSKRGVERQELAAVNRQKPVATTTAQSRPAPENVRDTNPAPGDQPAPSSDANAPKAAPDLPDQTAAAPQLDLATQTVEAGLVTRENLPAAPAVGAPRADSPKIAAAPAGKTAARNLHKSPAAQSTAAETPDDNNDDHPPAPIAGREPSSAPSDASRIHGPAELRLDQPSPATAVDFGDPHQPVAAAPAPAQASGPRNGSATAGELVNDRAASQSAAPAGQETNATTHVPAVIQSARVLERMGQTEMRIGVNAGDFGSVEVRASVVQDRLGASITANHQDLRAAMMAEMPSLQRAMEQHHLRLDQFHLGTQTGSRQQDAPAQQQPRSLSAAPNRFQFSPANEMVATHDDPSPAMGFSSSRLNVHA